jgi:hypothetical protein
MKQKENTMAEADRSLFAYCTICSLQQAAGTYLCNSFVSIGKRTLT